MGISASYISQDGGARLFDLEGAPEPGSLAAGLLGAHASQMQLPQIGHVPLAMPSVPQMPALPAMADNMDAGKVKVTAGDIPDVLERKLMPNGSIVASGNALCLSGEEGGTPGGRRFYATADGVKGFLTFSQIDPYAGGTVLAGTGDSANGASAQMDGKNGASLRFERSYVSVDVDPRGNRWLVVKNFYRMAELSPNGRIVRVSGEVEVPVARIPLGGGGGNGKYGVRLFYRDAESSDPVHPVPEALAFGAEEDIDTWNPDLSRFDCNYDDGGNALPNAPVKVIEVTTCPGGEPPGGGE